MDILILDDDRLYAQGLSDLIVQMGHQVTIAHDCATGRTLAESRQFDVILSDVELPDGDGRQLCEGLRMAGASQDAFMVAVTGRTDLGDSDFPEFDGYMHKPVTYAPLERALEEWRIALGLPKLTSQNTTLARTSGVSSKAP
jgi:DNA-binding response OmpR family regulator